MSDGISEAKLTVSSTQTKIYNHYVTTNTANISVHKQRCPNYCVENFWQPVTCLL